MNQVTLNHPKARTSRGMRSPLRRVDGARRRSAASHFAASYFSVEELREYSDAVSQFEWEHVTWEPPLSQRPAA